MNTVRHSRRWWFLALAMTALVVLGGAAAAVTATMNGSAAQGDTVIDQTPAWLLDIVSYQVDSLATGQVESASYALTTNAALHEAVPDLGPVDPTLADKMFYVVVLQGDFTAGRHMLGSEPATGPFLVMSISPETESVSMMGVVHERPNVDALGNMTPISVTAEE